MKICFNNRINFQKKLVARTISDNKEKYKIYQLENKDEQYLIDTLVEWGDGAFFLEVLDDFDNNRKNCKTYVIEDEYKNCLGYAEIDTLKQSCNELKFIETKQDLSYKNKSRTTKYIGETLVSFLLGLTKKTPQKDFVVPHTLCSAEGFYIDNCGFKQYDQGSVVSTYKPKEEFEDLISMNEEHTGSKIEFLI